MPARQTEKGRLLFGSAFNTASIPGLQVWLKGNTGIILNGSNVSDWSNQASPGVAFDAAQTVAGNQPPAGTSPVNGISGVTFGTTGKRLEFVPTTGLLNATPGVTVFAVIKSSTGVAQNVFSIAQGNAGSGDARAGLGISAGNVFSFYGSPTDSNGTVPNVTGGTHTTAAEIIHATYDLPTQAVNLYQNGTLVGNNAAYQSAASLFPATNPDSALMGMYVKFFSDPLTGDLLEFLLFSRALTLTEQTAVKNYLSARYAITVV